jgi:AraC-like DNA-binding protein
MGRRIIEDGFIPLSADSYLPVRVPGLFAECFGRLVDLVEAADPRRQPDRVMALQRLLAILWKDWRGDQSGPRHRQMETLVGEICAQPCEEYDFRRLARERFHLSYRHFQRVFKEHTGRPPYDFLLQCRMRWAARRLVEDDLPIATIARQVGYDVAGEFSRMFKRKMGMSPQQFREFGLGA